MKLTNRWNLFIYRVWAPLYSGLDRIAFRAGRRRSLQLLDLRAGESVLLPGVGTGADLPLLPPGVAALGIDLSPAMLRRARARLPLSGRMIELRLGDVQAVPVESGSFDAAVLHLILSVASDGRACFRETIRLLKPGGRVAIFDKFAPDSGRSTFFRRLLNVFTTLAGTDITRSFAEITSGEGFEILHTESGLLGGAYHILTVRKTERLQDT
jgi:ubiquinone/menaquinone biosynthesis C-methylase UbiE